LKEKKQRKQRKQRKSSGKKPLLHKSGKNISVENALKSVAIFSAAI